MERKLYLIKSVDENDKVRVLLGNIKYTEMEMICSTWFVVSLDEEEYVRLKEAGLTIILDDEDDLLDQ